MSRIVGQVISVHAFGATVRLQGGILAVVPRFEVETHRRRFEQALGERTWLVFEVQAQGRGKIAVLAPGAAEPVVAVASAEHVSLTNEVFEERLAAYLRETEDWAPPDQPQPFERHLHRKRRRMAQFARD